MSLLHLERKQAYRQLRKLVDAGELELRGSGAYCYYAIVE
jgi:hypothetical protein